MDTTNEKRLESQIQDILEAIDVTELFIEGMNFADFSQDQKTIFAVERSMGIVGITAKRLPTDFIDRYREIDWRNITGLGDKLTFGIFEVDLSVLWNVTQEDMPKLKKLIMSLVNSDS
jgi:uncharacterized protein with HEPN domain